MDISESTYSAASSVMYGMISALADAQSPLRYHFSITDSTFCTNSDGIEDTTDENSMQNIVSGAITG